MKLRLSSWFILLLLFTSYLYWFMVPMHLKISCFFLDVPGSAHCGPAASLRLEEGRRKGAPVVSQYQARISAS